MNSERGTLGRLTHVAGAAGLGLVRWKATTMARSGPKPISGLLNQWPTSPDFAGVRA